MAASSRKSSNRQPWVRESPHDIAYLSIVGYSPVHRPDAHLRIGELLVRATEFIDLPPAEWYVREMEDTASGERPFSESKGSIPANKMIDGDVGMGRVPARAETVYIESRAGSRAKGNRAPHRLVWGCHYEFADRGMIAGRLNAPMHQFVLRIRTSLCATVKQDRFLALLRECMAFYESSLGCYQAFIDIARVDELCGGRFYTEFAECSEPNPWHRDLEHTEWALMDLQARQRRVRGVFWGHMLGKEMAGMLDPTGTFVDEFNRLCESYVLAFHRAERLPGGGLYVRMSEEPLELVSDRSNVGTLAAIAACRFKQKLRERGML
ncbi:MAG: hypothetical protein JSR77_12125 [Planctomycetes bacterium]|nr:hypothetical protein [Planctomycetota bacterium]